MGAVRNHGNGLSDERFDGNYFLIMVLLAYILNFINIWDGPFPTFPKFVWSLERITLNYIQMNDHIQRHPPSIRINQLMIVLLKLT